MTALRAFLPGGDDCAPHDERRLARCLVVDPCDGGRSSLLLQFAFNRALRGLRTLYVCASREGLAARPPVRPTRGGGVAAPAGTSTLAPPARAREALRRIAVKYVPHGEALRELLLALPRRDGDAAHADHRRPARAAAAAGGGRRRRRGGGAPRRAEPGAAEPEQARAPARRDAGGVHRRARRPRRRLPERGARRRRRPPVALLVGAAAPARPSCRC